MAALPVEEVRSRVEADFDRIVNVLNKKIALQSISAKGITADHMKRSPNLWPKSSARSA